MAAPALPKKVTPAPTPVTVLPSETTDISEQRSSQDIAALAYELWQARGCPYGSPEEDWFIAERQLQGRSQR